MKIFKKPITVKRRFTIMGKEFSFARAGIFMLSFAIIGAILVYFVFAGVLSTSDETDQYNRINQTRQGIGAAPLALSGCLTNVARTWAQHMSQTGILSHSDGTNGAGTVLDPTAPGIVNLIDQYCPNTWLLAGENVGEGSSSSAIYNAFLASPHHYQNIVNANWQVTAVGAYRDANGILWIAQEFIQYKPCPSTAPQPTSCQLYTNPPAAAASGTTPSQGASVGITAKRNSSAYWTTDSNGKVLSYNGGKLYGDMSGRALNAPIVGMAVTPSGNGYWLVGSDGGIYAFGDAPFYGSMGGQHLNAPIVGIAASPTGGYWLVGRDGGVYAFGAGFYGSMGGQHLNAPIVGIAATSSGNGYWLVGSDGGVYAFGNAHFYGSTGGQALNKPIVSMAALPNDGGYWLVGSDGGIFTFGSAGFYGSAGNLSLPSAVVGALPSADGAGYFIVQSDGTALSYGDAQQVFGITIPYVNTPPSVPANVAISNMTTSSMSISWNASTDDRGVAGYNIYKLDGGAYSLVSSTSLLSYSVTGLAASTPYNFAVSAFDDYGVESAKSAVVTGTTLNTPPTVPQNLHLASRSISSIGLAWTASTDNQSVSSYSIYRNGVKIGSTTQPSYTDNNLSKSTTYKYQVSATDNQGASSGLSTVLSTTTCANKACSK